MENLKQKIHQQNNNRTEWVKHDTPQSVELYTLQEAEELQQAIATFDFLENADLEVASEIGDILYLCLRYQGLFGEITEPMQAAWNLAIDTAETVDIDPSDAIEMKLLRNGAKYPDSICSNGYGYEEAQRLSKQLWNHLGGDKPFYNWFSEL